MIIIAASGWRSGVVQPPNVEAPPAFYGESSRHSFYNINSSFMSIFFWALLRSINVFYWSDLWAPLFVINYWEVARKLYIYRIYICTNIYEWTVQLLNSSLFIWKWHTDTHTTRAHTHSFTQTSTCKHIYSHRAQIFPTQQKIKRFLPGHAMKCAMYH